MVDQHVMAIKTHKCKCCGERKPLDSFARSFLKHFGENKYYECIDCKVEHIYGEYNHDHPVFTFNVREEFLVKKILRWLFNKSMGGEQE